MPFCTQCGNRVHESDLFCASCGARQAVDAPAPGATIRVEDQVNPKTAKVLCYIPFVGWIAAIFVLASAKFRRDLQVRFHAFQGLYLFVVYLLVDSITTFRGDRVHFPPLFAANAVEGLLKLALLLVWIFMLVKVSQNETYRLPVIGELAERSLKQS
jgi:uncharacterized membrane protein